MIRKTKRKPPKEATNIRNYVIPECNRILTENNQSVFRMRKAIVKLIQVDSFVPAWPWEM